TPFPSTSLFRSRPRRGPRPPPEGPRGTRGGREHPRAEPPLGADRARETERARAALTARAPKQAPTDGSAGDVPTAPRSVAPLEGPGPRLAPGTQLRVAPRERVARHGGVQRRRDVEEGRVRRVLDLVEVLARAGDVGDGGRRAAVAPGLHDRRGPGHVEPQVGRGPSELAVRLRVDHARVAVLPLGE